MNRILGTRTRGAAPILVLAGLLAIGLAGGLSAATAAPGPTDLALTKSDSADPVTEGGNFVYTIQAANTGANDATDVIVTDVLPNQVATLCDRDERELHAAAEHGDMQPGNGGCGRHRDGDDRGQGDEERDRLEHGGAEHDDTDANAANDQETETTRSTRRPRAPARARRRSRAARRPPSPPRPEPTSSPGPGGLRHPRVRGQRPRPRRQGPRLR